MICTTSYKIDAKKNLISTEQLMSQKQWVQNRVRIASKEIEIWATWWFYAKTFQMREGSRTEDGIFS